MGIFKRKTQKQLSSSEESVVRARMRDIKIGLFFAGALTILAAFILIVGDVSHLFQKKGYPLYVYFDSVAGLEKGTVVRMAGVKVGYLKDIRLKGNKAEVVLSIYPDVEIKSDSKAALSALGLLGEKYVEILPGKGAIAAKTGGIIEGIPSLGFDQLGTMLLSLGKEVKDVAEALRSFIGEEDSESNFRETWQRLSHFLGELNNFFGSNRESLNQSVQRSSQAIQKFDTSIKDISQNMEELIQLLKETVEENRSEIKENLTNMKELIKKTEESLTSLNETLGKTKKKEGTLGKLIYEDDLYERTEGVVDHIDKMIHPLSSLQAKLGLRTEYYSESNLVKNYLSFDIWLTPTKYMFGQIISDPWLDKFTYSLLGGIRWGIISPKAGIMESKAGAGIDIYALKDKLMWSLESFDFNRHPRPRFRLWTRYAAMKNLYLLFGVEDFALAPHRELFFGLGFGL